MDFPGLGFGTFFLLMVIIGGEKEIHTNERNSINIVFQHSPRRVVMCLRPLGKSKFSGINTMRFNFFTSSASAMYNILPKDIKSIPTLNEFKAALDSFIQSFPDTPPTPGYIAANGNSLVEWAGSSSQ